MGYFVYDLADRIIGAKKIHIVDLSVLGISILIVVGTVMFLKKYMKEDAR